MSLHWRAMGDRICFWAASHYCYRGAAAGPGLAGTKGSIPHLGGAVSSENWSGKGWRRRWTASEVERGDTGQTRRTTAFRAAARTTYAAMDSVGLWAWAGHRPRWVRIFSMTAACSMKAMIRMGPPHCGWSNGSAL